MKKKCLICNKEFNTRPDHIKRGWGKFCSLKCFGKYRSIKGLMKGKNNPSWKGGEKVKRKCLICNKEFFIKSSQLKYRAGKYCSLKCRGIAERKANNLQWKGGFSISYQKQLAERRWEKIVKQVYKRDNYQCQICGERDIQIDCHHIIPWRISHDDSLKNLIAVCKSCHTRLDNKWRKYERNNLSTLST